MPNESQRTTLVTGASGFVGNNLVRLLLSRGRNVRVLVREPGSQSLSGLKVETIVGDVCHSDCLHQALSGVSRVFHLAGAISIDGQHHQRMHQVNVEGTANIVEACLSEGVERLVHFSSIHALTPFPKDRPIDEERGLALANNHLAYDRTKAAGEQQVLAGIRSGLDAVILNPVGIFGPHDFGPSPGGEFLSQLIGRRLPGIVQAGYFWVDVRDVVHAALAAEELGRCGQRYILPGEYATFKTIADWVFLYSGARPPLLNVPIWLARMTAPVVVGYSRLLGIRPLVTPEAIEIIGCHQNIVTQKAELELGFQARPLEATIADTVRWFQSRDCDWS